MKKNIIFLPFINGNSHTSEGKKWRDELEKRFLGDPEIKDLTLRIDQIRQSKPADGAPADAFVDYYKRLHQKKSKRQAKWLKRLIAETAVLLESKLDALPEDVKNSDDCIIVAAFPEFFWYDINDNNKHEIGDTEKNGKYIIGYHKPLYDTNMIDKLLRVKNNLLAQLTVKYRNLIIFAGTAMWKIINEENHEDEKVDNTLIIYHTGDVANTWSKNFFSPIDGFDSPEKENKKGTYGVIDRNGRIILNYDHVPFTAFNGVKFTYDICLDFVKGTGHQPLSTSLCNGRKTDVNVLIAAGMPINDKDLTNINSPVILRCDGLRAPYAEIAPNSAYTAGNPNSISSGMIIGALETVIDVQDAQDQD